MGIQGSGIAAGLAVAVLLLGACTGNEDTAGPAGPSPSPSPSPSVSPTSPGVESSPTERERVLAVYEEYLAATATAMATADPELAALEAVAEDQGLVAAQARVANLTRQERRAEGEFVPTVQSVEIDGDTARVRDCYRADIVEVDAESGEQVGDRGGARFDASATLTRRAGDWTVTEFLEGEFCVPEELAATVEERYLAFWEALAAAGRPPNPDHPALAETAAGGQLQGLRERLSRFREQGYEVRGKSTPHPRVDEIFAHDTKALVRDCRELDPDGGVYDAETGELVEGGARPGQTSLWEARLERIGGSWRVVEADLKEEDSSCEPDSF